MTASRSVFFTTLTALSASLAFTAPAQADIREIPPEEMTEEYIRNTTVIVRKATASGTAANSGEGQNAQAGKTRIRVSPLEQLFSEGNELQQQGSEVDILPPQDQYLSERQQLQLANESAYQFESPQHDPARLLREQALRAQGNYPAGEPIDFSQLTFPNGLNDAFFPGLADVTLPEGLSATSSPLEFVLSIPNTNNHPDQTFSTPNGEFDVEITPETINFRINAPR